MPRATAVARVDKGPCISDDWDMRIPYYHVDAFASRPFGGNPAGVCILDRELPDAILQAIAAENNLPETAFCVRGKDGLKLRWFTPAVEVDLCGHATLATAHVLFTELGHPEDRLIFQSQSGNLAASRRGELVELDFPSRPPSACEAPARLLRGLGREPVEVLKSRDYLAVFESEAEVEQLEPDMGSLARLDALGVIATARGKRGDFVSRFFAPSVGIPEDPATGSSHCTLIPFWAARLGKEELFARQISPRGGEFHCRLLGDRVGIGGRAVVFCRGELEVAVPPAAPAP